MLGMCATCRRRSQRLETASLLLAMSFSRVHERASAFKIDDTGNFQAKGQSTISTRLAARVKNHHQGGMPCTTLQHGSRHKRKVGGFQDPAGRHNGPTVLCSPRSGDLFLQPTWPMVNAINLEHESPPTSNQKKRELQHTSSVFLFPTFLEYAVGIPYGSK